MRPISPSSHTCLDYLIGTLLVALPWLAGFNLAGGETAAALAAGCLIFTSAALADTRCGLVRRIPVRWHLAIDLLAGVFLTLSPWLLEFAPHPWLPHVGIGLLHLGGVLVTRTREPVTLIRFTPPSPSR